MPQLIDVPGHGQVEFPDGMSDAEIVSAIQRNTPYKPVKATDDMTGPQKFLAGMGKGFVDLGRGAGQMLGLVDQKSIDESRLRDAPLMDTGAGFAGNLAGTIAATAPALAIPGANSVAGAALIGGASGALQPTATGESRLQNTALGAATGGAGQYGLGKLAGVAGNRLAGAEAAGASRAAQNSVKDATLRAAQDAGYVVPPSMAGDSIPGRILEGVSGKYKTNQLAAVKNQNVTDALARRALGLSEDAPITPGALQGVRDQAYVGGYAPIAQLGTVATDGAYNSALNKIVADFAGASKSFPGAAKNEVSGFIEALRVPQFDAGDALSMTRLLRDQATNAYAQGNNTLGKASRQAATALEDQIERTLAGSGKNGAEALKAFRDARTLIAKTHSVEDALVEGGGKVNAKVLGAALQRGKPLTDELKTIGAFANNFKDVSGVPQSGWTNPLTVLDAFGSAGMAGAGAGPMSVALPIARVVSRYGILSGAGQKAFAQSPNYGPGMLTRKTPEMLDLLRRLNAGGLLGLSANAVQQ